MENLIKSEIKKGLAGRFQELLEVYGDNPNSVATKIKSSTSSNIYLMLDGDKNNLPNLALIIKILDIYPEISHRWFLTGKGPKFTSNKAFESAIVELADWIKLLDKIEELIPEESYKEWKVYNRCLNMTFLDWDKKGKYDQRDIRNELAEIKSQIGELSAH